MKKKKMNVLNMTKTELVEFLDKSNKKIKKLEFQLKKFMNLIIAFTIFGLLGYVFSSSITVTVGLSVDIVITLCAIVVEKLKSFEYEKKDIVEQQLEDVITLDYEKKRYSLEKEYEKNNDISVDKLILNTQAKKELLQQYKDELSKYCCNNWNNEINNELATQQYLIDNLQSIQKVKK